MEKSFPSKGASTPSEFQDSYRQVEIVVRFRDVAIKSAVYTRQCKCVYFSPGELISACCEAIEAAAACCEVRTPCYAPSQ